MLLDAVGSSAPFMARPAPDSWVADEGAARWSVCTRSTRAGPAGIRASREPCGSAAAGPGTQHSAAQGRGRPKCPPARPGDREQEPPVLSSSIRASGYWGGEEKGPFSADTEDHECGRKEKRTNERASTDEKDARPGSPARNKRGATAGATQRSAREAASGKSQGPVHQTSSAGYERASVHQSPRRR